MDLRIVGKNVEISQSIENYIQQKIGKLTRYLPKIDEAKIEIREEKTKSPQHRFTAQVTLNGKDVLLRGEERGENIFTVIDAVAEVLTHQIKRYKGKLHKRGRDISLVRQNPASGETVVSEEIDDLPRVVRVKRFAVKSMLVDEAAEQMELLGHDFFLFIGSETGSLQLIYRRKDGNYGVIEPVLA